MESLILESNPLAPRYHTLVAAAKGASFLHPVSAAAASWLFVNSPLSNFLGL